MITPDFLQSQNIDFIHKGREFIVDCPYCGKAKHLYLNESGVFKCHHCQEAGNWINLKQQYPESPQILEPIEKQSSFPDISYVELCQRKLLGPNGTKAIEYLTSRKITLKQIHKYKIGLDKNLLTIPVFENEEPVNVKYRSLPPNPKQYTRWVNGKSSLFNGDLLNKLKAEDEIIITEGEIDCISLDGLGINAVGATGGAGTIILNGLNN